MTEREAEIVNRLGLHARAAAKLVNTAARFQSRVTVTKDGEEVDAKSILGVLLLAASQGTHLTIRCEGEDEDEGIQPVSGRLANTRVEVEEDLGGDLAAIFDAHLMMLSDIKFLGRVEERIRNQRVNAEWA